MDTPKITYAGVDWITATSRSDDAGGSWWEKYCKYRSSAQDDGETELSYNNGWYHGVKIGQVQWGYSESLGYIIIASGSEANRLWREIKPSSHNITRLDICADFQFPKPIPLAKHEYRKRDDRPEKVLPILKLWENTRGGCTLYVGSRQSQQFGRLYDKGVESKTLNAGLLWRAEVEYKKPLSAKVANVLYEMEPETLPDLLLGIVLRWFHKREIEIPLSDDSLPEIEIGVQQRITTHNKRLTWLRSQVQPTVQKLVQAGLGRDTVESLGFTPEQAKEIWPDELLLLSSNLL